MKGYAKQLEDRLKGIVVVESDIGLHVHVLKRQCQRAALNHLHSDGYVIVDQDPLYHRHQALIFDPQRARNFRSLGNAKSPFPDSEGGPHGYYFDIEGASFWTSDKEFDEKNGVIRDSRQFGFYERFLAALTDEEIERQERIMKEESGYYGRELVPEQRTIKVEKPGRINIDQAWHWAPVQPSQKLTGKAADLLGIVLDPNYYSDLLGHYQGGYMPIRRYGGNVHQNRDVIHFLENLTTMDSEEISRMERLLSRISTLPADKFIEEFTQTLNGTYDHQPNEMISRLKIAAITQGVRTKPLSEREQQEIADSLR